MPRETRHCRVCNKEFKEWPSQQKATCSRDCKRVYISKLTSGKPKSNEHRKNISKALKKSESAKKQWFKKGKDNPAYGRNQTGPANHNWKGGKTNSNQKKRNDPRYHDWRKQVFERDKFKCQKCGNSGWLQAHHITPISVDESKIWDVDNGLTVCIPCHEKIHGRFIGKFKQSS